MREGLLRLSHLQIGIAQIVVCIGEVGFDFHRCLEMSQGFIDLDPFPKRRPPGWSESGACLGSIRNEF